MNDEYIKKLTEILNQKVEDLTMNNYDDILRDAKLSVDDFYKEVEEKYTKNSENIINPSTNLNTKKMIIGQENIKEACKYTRYYKYSVKRTAHNDSTKNNYVFSMDNSFFKRILSSPTNRFNWKNSNVQSQTLSFKYKPKTERTMIDGELFYFKPFEIIINTTGCYDFIVYHTENNGINKEIIKGLNILNIKKVQNKLKELFEEFDLSEKAKNNMMASLNKHLNGVQSSFYYEIGGNYEEHQITEEELLIILDDFDDGDLADSLSSYLI